LQWRATVIKTAASYNQALWKAGGSTRELAANFFWNATARIWATIRPSWPDSQRAGRRKLFFSEAPLVFVTQVSQQGTGLERKASMTLELDH
jgi:hypothetical protein